MTYFVSLIPRPSASVKQIQDAMNVADDWYRFADNQWIVVTTRTARELNVLLEPFVKPEGQAFVCEVALGNRSGWMPKDVWEWCQKHTS